MKSITQAIASDIMSKPAICFRPEQLLSEADSMLIEGRISGAPVVVDGKLVGVISRSDIARMYVLMQSLDGQVTDETSWDEEQADGFQHVKPAEYRGFRQMMGKLTIKDAMHDQVVSCKPNAPVTEIAAQMVKQHIHRIIVVEGDEPIGLVSSLDIVRLAAEQADLKK